LIPSSLRTRDAILESKIVQIGHARLDGVIEPLQAQLGLSRPLAQFGDMFAAAFGMVLPAVDDRGQHLLQPLGREQPILNVAGDLATIKESAVAPVNLIRGDPFKALVRTDVSPQGLGAYIVITRAKSKLGSGRNVEGVGFAEYRTLLASYGVVHALYEVRVIDGKTFGSRHV
jgi:hypothetical protein